MKHLKSYKAFEGKLEDDYTWWFGENQDVSPLINAIKIVIKEHAPEFINEFYYRITNGEDPEEVISDIYDKGNVQDEESLGYFNELKRRNRKKEAIERMNNN